MTFLFKSTTHHFPVTLDKVLEVDGGGEADLHVRALRADEGEETDGVIRLRLGGRQGVLGRLPFGGHVRHGLADGVGERHQGCLVHLHGA